MAEKDLPTSVGGKVRKEHILTFLASDLSRGGDSKKQILTSPQSRIAENLEFVMERLATEYA
ncbi:hypothetical protein LTR46_009745 [Exophiala xenobiotica]|nr:hypothetical protein LTR46_009745 [Exophiala xenobiotica]